MTNNYEQQILDTVEALLHELYQAKGYDKTDSSVLERNIFEARATAIYHQVKDNLEHFQFFIEDNYTYVEDEDLENDNYELRMENDKLKGLLMEVSEVVNRTWS